MKRKGTRVRKSRIEERIRLQIILSEELYIIFLREYHEYQNEENIEISEEEFIKKIFKDFLGRRYEMKRKKLPHYKLKEL